MMTRPTTLFKSAVVLSLAATVALASTATAGGGDAVRLSTKGARLTLSGGQPEESIPDGPAPRGRYGAEGTEWILFGTGVAHDFDDSTDFNLNIGYSRFLADDVEGLVELGAWYHSQVGDDAVSINPTIGFRWHFYNQGDTSLFISAGVGVLGATDNVPDLGTGFNFTPRAGIGLTHQISDAGTRLIAGLRWHHISNARVSGEDRNPSRDAPMLFLQLAMPF